MNAGASIYSMNETSKDGRNSINEILSDPNSIYDQADGEYNQNLVGLVMRMLDDVNNGSSFESASQKYNLTLPQILPIIASVPACRMMWLYVNRDPTLGFAEMLEFRLFLEIYNTKDVVIKETYEKRGAQMVKTKEERTIKTKSIDLDKLMKLLSSFGSEKWKDKSIDDVANDYLFPV